MLFVFHDDEGIYVPCVLHGDIGDSCVMMIRTFHVVYFT